MRSGNVDLPAIELAAFVDFVDAYQFGFTIFSASTLTGFYSGSAALDRASKPLRTLQILLAAAPLRLAGAHAVIIPLLRVTTITRFVKTLLTLGTLQPSHASALLSRNAQGDKCKECNNCSHGSTSVEVAFF